MSGARRIAGTTAIAVAPTIFISRLAATAAEVITAAAITTV
jgi:hypothetical protein